MRISGFEQAQYPNNTLDLVISNVPFGDFQVFDSRNKDIAKFKIHNYFIARTARLLRPGGMAAIVTTSGTMDAKGEEVRKWLNRNGMDLVSAIRLPSSAFEESAGTEVTTDILFLQKRTGVGSAFPANKFLNSVTVRTREVAAQEEDAKGKLVDTVVTQSISINEYYVNHPEHMLGEMKFADEVNKGGLYRGDSQTLYSENPSEVPARLESLIEALPESVYDYSQTAEPSQTTKAPKGRMKITGDKITITNEYGDTEIKVDGELKINGKKTTQAEVLKQYADLKNSYFALQEAERANKSDDWIDAYRRDLNTEYDSFVERYGRLNKNNKLGFIDEIDLEFPTVQALENITTVQVPGGRKQFEITKAAIFNERVYRPVEIPQRAETAADAIRISQSFYGKLRPEVVAKLLGVPRTDIEQRLVDEGLAYIDPVDGRLTERSEYLSGNVREKYEQAVEAAKTDPSLQRNADDLERVLPKTVPVSMISLKLGSTWIPMSVTKAWIARTTGVDNLKFEYNDKTREYTLMYSKSWAPENESLGTAKRTAMDLIEIALNNKTLSISKVVTDNDGKERTVKDVEATAEAQMALDNLNQLFIDYAKDNHAKEIEEEYNRI